MKSSTFILAKALDQTTLVYNGLNDTIIDSVLWKQVLELKNR